MNTARTRLAVALAAGMLIGWFAAMGAVHCRMHGGWHDKPKMLEHFSRELKLTADQKEKVRKIIEATREQIKVLHNEAKPRFDAIRADTDARIRAILTPEQLPRFEKLRTEMLERHQKKFRDGPGPE